MRVDRRGFLLLVGGAALLPARAGRAAPDGAPAIHVQTRNTLRGSLGERRARLEERGPFKTYPGAERLALPPCPSGATRPLAEVVRGYTPTPGFAPEPLGLEQLGWLLHLTNGVTGRAGGTLLRAAPSAGALYAGEVYVVAERVRGLASGVYYYGVADRELTLIRPGAWLGAVAKALETPAAVANAPVVVILSNLFRRYTVRYRNRGYRYALIDSGHIGENLRLAARSVGLGETAPLRFQDDALSDLLRIDGREEAVCAVHALGRPGPPATGRPGPPLAEKQLADPAALQGPGPLTRRYHEATKLVASGESAAPASPPTPDAAPARFGVALPRGPTPGASVEEAIRRRRSARRFEAKPIRLAELAFVLEAAYGHAALERTPGIDLYLIPHRVTGLDPGLYRYEPRAQRLAGLHARDLRVVLTRACIGQRKAGSSAAAVLMAARFEPSSSALGTRRYRDQLLEAGAIGQRIYLAAEALGLAARNLAAFLDDDLNALVGLDPDRAGVVHLTVFGAGD